MQRNICGQTFDVIEDVLPILDVKVSVRAPRPTRLVTLAPQGRKLRPIRKEGRVNFTVPRITGHQTVVLDF